MAYETYDKKTFETLPEVQQYSRDAGMGYHEVQATPKATNPGAIMNPNTGTYENRNNSGQLMNDGSNSDKYSYNQGTGQYDMNWSTPGAISSSTERGAADNDIMSLLSAESQKVFGDETALTNTQYGQQVVDIGKQFDEQKRVTEQAQKSETGTTSLGIARIGGYLGGSASGMGVMQNLAENQRREINTLEQQRQSALQQAASARDSKQLALAYKKIDEAKQLEQQIYDRKQTSIQQTRQYESDQIAKAQALAPGIIDIMSGDPEIDQMAIEELAQKYGIDPMYLQSAIAKERAGIKPDLKELNGVLYEYKNGALTKVEGQEGATGGLREEDKQKAALGLAENLSKGGTPTTYQEAYDQLYGGGAVIGDSVGEIMGLPSYNTESTNPGATRSNRNNNPGNIKVSAYTKEFDGVVGVESKPSTDTGNFLIFDSPEAGFAAMGRLLQEGEAYKGNAEMAMRKWSGGVNKDGTFNGKGYGASDMGLNPDEDFQSQIQDSGALEELVQKMAKREGYKPGTTKSNVEDTPIDPNSKSILAVTGLSMPSFQYLTKGTPALARMSSPDRQKYMKEAEDWANSNGVDISTFMSQYEALNKVVSQNIGRAGNTAVAQDDLMTTLDTLTETSIGANLKGLKVYNVAKIWAGKQVNDKQAQAYAFALGDLRNGLSYFFAAQQNKTSPDIGDNRDAEKIIEDGLSTGSIEGLKGVITSTTKRLQDVANMATERSNRQVWELFGVGDNYKANMDSPETSTSTPTSKYEEGYPTNPSIQESTQVLDDFFNQQGVK